MSSAAAASGSAVERRVLAASVDVMSSVADANGSVDTRSASVAVMPNPTHQQQTQQTQTQQQAQSAQASAAPGSSAPVPARTGSIVMQTPVTSCSHVNVCRPWISWKKGNMSEYVSRARVFFDHLHQQIVLFTGSPPNKMWLSDRATQTWMDYPLHLPPHNDIIGAQFSPDRTHVALRVSDAEVKVLSTATGEVVTARSCRGTSSRMISVHWILDPALSKSSSATAASALFLLFVTNAGVELYELTSEKSLSAALGASSAGAQPPAKNKLKHIKTATYNIVYHWILLDENILLLVDSKNVFQAYKLSSKQISKLCKFELDCGGTSLNPPPHVSFHREQICLVWLYGRMVIVFINEVKGQLHLLSLAQSHHASDEMEQTAVFCLYQPGKYDVSVLDNVLVVHNVAAKVSMLFDVRSESKTTITEPLPVGPPLATSSYAMGAAASAGGGGLLCGSSTANGGINFFDPASMHSGQGLVGPSASPGMASLAPASFHPYVKWTFLSPSFVWESTGDQQQGNLWTLHINVQQVAFSWPHSKRARLVDFLLKRSTVQAKHLILQIILQIVCTEPSSLALLSRLFSLLNRMNYDHRMNPNASLPAPVNLASLPLLPPFSNPPSAANTAPNSAAASPAPNSAPFTRNMSQSMSSPSRPPQFGAAGAPNSPLGAGMLPSFGSRIASPVAHRASSAAAFPPSPASDGSSMSGAVPVSLPVASAAPSAGGVHADPLSYALDDSLSVLSCEMLDHAALQAAPLTVEHNAQGYMLVSQMDLYTHVFSRAIHAGVPLAQIIPVVVEYLRSIHRHFLKTEDILNDLLVSLLLQAGRYLEFHQYLQYHILNDSLPIANRLISCAPVYPPAYQLGIDMLYRLGQTPRLIRVMLQHHQVLAALQLVPSFRAPFLAGDTPGLAPRDFLAAALETENEMTFYNTYRFFENRNMTLRGSAAFVAGDGCDQFVHKYEELFGTGGTGGVASAAGAGGLGQQPNTVQAASLRDSIAADVSKVKGAVPGMPLPLPPRQFINLGDDDDEDGEDGDIEYAGEKPSAYGQTPTASAGAAASAASSTQSASASSSRRNSVSGSDAPASSDSVSASAPGSILVSSSGGDGSGEPSSSSVGAVGVVDPPAALSSPSELVHLPSPLDLSTTIPSVGFDDDPTHEDAAAESGLGATDGHKSAARSRRTSVDPATPAQVDICGIDGSFGGSSLGAAGTDEAHASGSKKKKKLFGTTTKFQAEPAM